MGIGFGEILILFMVVGLMIFPIVGSIVGIIHAQRRRRQGVRSVGAVVWASVACVLALPTIVSPLFFLGFPTFGLTLAWIICAVQANRHVARIARPLTAT